MLEAGKNYFSTIAIFLSSFNDKMSKVNIFFVF